MVTLHTSHGDIVLQLAHQEAPNTVANFLHYCHQGFYHDTLFHRVIKDFMIQGGGFGPGMQQKETADPILNEANNQLSNRRGAIAMARTSDPHSATAQFFINVKDNGFLNFRAETPQGWGYCVFGAVIAGMSVVDQIATVETERHSSGHQDVPRQAVVITRRCCTKSHLERSCPLTLSATRWREHGQKQQGSQQLVKL